jgi:glycosyltransferase involved in cell wall biosynthesis
VPVGDRRTILDVSSLARWVGPPVGILRVEQALAAYARAQRPDIVLSIYDTVAQSFREVATAWAGSIIGWDGAIDAVTFDHRRHWSLLRRWRSPRHPMLMALERKRLTAYSAGACHIIDAMQKIIRMRRRLPPPFAGHDGRRRQIVPVELALGPALSLGPQDTVLTVGYDWAHQDPCLIDAQRRRSGFRYVAMCHDIMALRSPEFLSDHSAAAFRRYWTAMFSMADRILVHSGAVESDIRDYCTDAGIELADMRVVRLGFDPPRERSSKQLPAGLDPGHFALFVGTIDPRKGHAMLLRLWARLLAAGVPQRHRFKLVFVGRRGWKVDTLLSEIEAFAATERSLVHLEELGDCELSALYAAAAFCVFPSLYEGFGLPIIEAFAHGRATIASTGGALPEMVGDLSPCLDPYDEEAWFIAIKRWIEDPEARAPYEERIRSSFSWPDWNAAAARIFEAACDRSAMPGGESHQ